MDYLGLIWIELQCPNCNYKAEVQLIDVKCERQHICYNCKSLIRLTDMDSSVHNGIKSINKALSDLKKSFKNFK